MRMRIGRGMLCLSLVLCLSFGAWAADVTQGKCVSNDKEKQIITIEEYDLKIDKEHRFGQPTGKQLKFNVATSLIGKNPEPGDILRIAFEKKGEENVAIRIMNVTKQDIMKK